MSTYCSTSLPHSPANGTHIDWPGTPFPEPEYSNPDTAIHSARHGSEAILFGESLAIRRLRSQVERIAPHFRRALVRGEPGTGKRLVAEALHSVSAAGGPFVVCKAAFLAEALAIGPEASAATTLLDSVRGGTLYLEELAEVPYRLQPRLLRFIAEQRAERGSGDRSLTAWPSPPENRRGIRIIGSSARDLKTMAGVGQFRADLHSEFSVVELIVPPLRQRVDDLPVLAAWVLGQVSRLKGLQPKGLSRAALIELSGRTWTANLRELEKVLTQAGSVAHGALIEVRDLAHALEVLPEIVPQRAVGIGAEKLQDVIYQHVVEVLTRCGGNKLRAAEVLGISRSTLYRMLDAGPGGTSA